MSLPVLPSAQAVTPAELASYGASIVAWAESISDVGEVREAANKWAAITEYVRRTSREGLADAEAALRRLEARVGALLGPAEHGGDRRSDQAHHDDLGLHSQTKNDLRLLAENPDVVEEVIAASTDADPPSRRKVVAEIKRRNIDAETTAARQEDRAWAADLRAKAEAKGNSVADDRRRQQIRMAVRAALDAIDALAKWSPDEVAWAVSTSPAHVATDLALRLANATDQMEKYR